MQVSDRLVTGSHLGGIQFYQQKWSSDADCISPSEAEHRQKETEDDLNHMTGGRRHSVRSKDDSERNSDEHGKQLADDKVQLQ